MDQVWKGLSYLDPRDPGGFYKKPLLRVLQATGLLKGNPQVFQCRPKLFAGPPGNSPVGRPHNTKSLHD